ncbi:MAG TPA: HU family DNA-binding protein [Spirochaetota bacterium]|nr:HU family DNA-binding protein [Spirochaetota bacterium]
MTRADIIDQVSRDCSLDKKEVQHVIETMLRTIVQSVEKGGRVELRGFGTFYQATKKGRKVYSPIAFRKVEVPDKTLLAFKASKNNEHKHIINTSGA